MKSIYILLTKTDTNVSKLIGLATSNTYTHVSLSFDASLQPLYSFARRKQRLPLPAGLREESFQNGFFSRHSDIPCALYELSVQDEVYEVAKKRVEAMMCREFEYKFNVIGLFLCKLHIPLDRKHHYFCSEFVGETLLMSNALELPKVPSLMRPSDYMDFDEMVCLYEGRLCDLMKGVYRSLYESPKVVC